jgi:hypothetical protein
MKGTTKAKGVQEYGTKEDIWASGQGSNRRLEQNA